MEVLQFPKDKKKHVYFEKKEKLEKGGEKNRKRLMDVIRLPSVALGSFRCKSLPLFARGKDKNGIVW